MQKAPFFRRREFWQGALEVVLIIAIALLFRTHIGSLFRVEGNSMVPTLADGDILFVDKLGYRVGEPQRGDVVIVRPPHDDKTFFVKRVIGLPGETIEFRNGDIIVERIKLREDYLSEDNYGHTCPAPYSSIGECPPDLIRESSVVEIPDGYFFVLGDNRRASSDSRSWIHILPGSDGALPRQNIIGRTIFDLSLDVNLVPHFLKILQPTY